MTKEKKEQLIRHLKYNLEIGADYLITDEDAVEIIRALEQTRWIPVSERLPERDVDVLAYHRNESFDYQYVSWIDDYSGKWSGFIGNLSDEVLAWQPLPEKYKEAD